MRDIGPVSSNPMLAGDVTGPASTNTVAKLGGNALDSAGARSALGLAIGTNVQAYDADLTTLGAGGNGARTFLGVAIGSDVQAYSVFLTNIGGSIPANVILAGPATGADAQAAPRVLVTADFPSNVVGGVAISAAAHRFLAGVGLASAGAVTMTGAVVGDTVIGVVDVTGATSVKSNFESTITVNNQIQQTGGVLTAHVLLVLLVAKS